MGESPVVAHHEVALGERLGLPVPEPAVADARVDEDDRGAGAGRLERDLRAVDAGGRQRYREGDWASRRRAASTCKSAQATLGCSSTNGRNSQGVSP